MIELENQENHIIQGGGEGFRGCCSPLTCVCKHDNFWKRHFDESVANMLNDTQL